MGKDAVNVRLLCHSFFLVQVIATYVVNYRSVNEYILGVSLMGGMLVQQLYSDSRIRNCITEFR
jgi:hypothetical protein